MKIYVDENKGDKSSFYLLAYVYGDESDITSFENDAAKIKDKHRGLGIKFKGIHANKIKDGNRILKSYVEEILKLFKIFLEQQRLHYFILIQSVNKLENNFGVIKDYLTESIQKIRSPQFPDLNDKDVPNIVECAAQLWGIFQYPNKFKNVQSVDLFVDSCGAILNYKTESRTIVDLQGRKKRIPFYDLIKISMRSIAKLVSCENKKEPLYINSYQAIADDTSITLQICDILSNYMFNALRKEKGNTGSMIVYKWSQIKDLLCIDRSDVSSLAKNFDAKVNCINNKDFMYFED